MSPRAPVNFLKSPLPIILFISILFFALSPFLLSPSQAFGATYYVTPPMAMIRIAANLKLLHGKPSPKSTLPDSIRGIRFYLKEKKEGLRIDLYSLIKSQEI